MIVNKGIVIRIKPNASQRVKLAQHFGCNRFLWNYFLSTRIAEYQADKTGSSYYRDAAELTKLKNTPEFSWLYDASIGSEQRTLKNLDDAYRRFFKGKARFPRFKAKKAEQSFTVCGKLAIKGKRVYIPKFPEGLRFNRDLPDFTKINNVTIKQTASGKYYAVLGVEAEATQLPDNGKQVGVDLGLVNFAVFSNGKRIKAPKHFRRQQAALKRAQQHLARKKKGSKRRELQRIKVAGIHEKIANSRKDFLHKTSAFAVRHFGFIGVEDLNVKGMVRNRSLAKSISDASWGEFLRMLEYKCQWYGRELVKVGRFYPSSKSCSECGFVVQSLPLAIREWKCHECEATHDRDLNAAINVLREAIKWQRQSAITDVESLSVCA